MGVAFRGVVEDGLPEQPLSLLEINRCRIG